MTEKTKNKAKSSRKNGKKGGRPRGRKNNLTIEREEYLERFKNTVAKRSASLLSAHTVLATGSIKVFVIRTRLEGSGKNKRVVKDRPELVTGEDEIINALDYEYGDGDNPNDEENYYFVSTKDPDNQAINSLMDRTFGKPKESKEVKHSGLSLKEVLLAIEEEENG